MLVQSSVFIIEDDKDLCQSLQELLESVRLQTKVFHDSLAFLANFKAEQTEGCILLDIRMPQMGGLELQEQLNLRKNSLPIIFMTGHGDILTAVRAMKHGAFDFLTKPFEASILLEKVQKALAYHREFLSFNKEYSVLQERFNSLTPRGKEILKLIVAGKLNKEIAYLLGISIKTVELHRAHTMKKMQATTAAELVKFYLAVTKIQNV